MGPDMGAEGKHMVRYSLHPDMFREEKGKQFENKLCILVHTVIEASFSAAL